MIYKYAVKQTMLTDRQAHTGQPVHHNLTTLHIQQTADTDTSEHVKYQPIHMSL